MNIDEKVCNALIKILETKFNVQVQGHLEEKGVSDEQHHL